MQNLSDNFDYNEIFNSVLVKTKNKKMLMSQIKKYDFDNSCEISMRIYFQT